MKILKDNLGFCIKDIRDNMRINQTELASILNTSRTMIHNIESNYVSNKKINKKLLNLDLDIQFKSRLNKLIENNQSDSICDFGMKVKKIGITYFCEMCGISSQYRKAVLNGFYMFKNKRDIPYSSILNKDIIVLIKEKIISEQKMYMNWKDFNLIYNIYGIENRNKLCDILECNYMVLSDYENGHHDVPPYFQWKLQRKLQEICPEIDLERELLKY